MAHDDRTFLNINTTVSTCVVAAIPMTVEPGPPLASPGKLNPHLVNFLRCYPTVQLEALHILVKEHLTFFYIAFSLP